MKAVICPKYGPPEVLRLTKVEKPVPKDDEVCIRVYATAATASDTYIRGYKLPLKFWVAMRFAIGFTKPRKSVIGLILAGEIESIGKEVKRFKPGDKVYGMTCFGLGAYAEYKCMGETDSINSGCLAVKPESISYEEATVVAYGGLLALQQIEKCNIRVGTKVLVYGASGTSGTMAVQILKSLGAEVTAVCGAGNLEFVKFLGADKALDYSSTESLGKLEAYEYMVDTAGKRKSSELKDACKKALLKDGGYYSIDDEALKPDSSRLARLNALIEAHHIKPVVDRVYPLETIAEAHRYVEEGHKRGGVAITIG